jgi:hypothetical protein
MGLAFDLIRHRLKLIGQTPQGLGDLRRSLRQAAQGNGLTPQELGMCICVHNAQTTARAIFGFPSQSARLQFFIELTELLLIVYISINNPYNRLRTGTNSVP